MEQRLQEKELLLHKQLRDLGPLAIAYSGGLDSRFLAYTALQLGLDVLALHVRGPHIPSGESHEAEAWATDHGLPLQILTINPLQNSSIAGNPKDRCYHCKHTVFQTLLRHAQGRTLCDGTNASDSGEYRPGLRALQELGIVSPLALAGISKVEIRALGGKNGLDRPEQVAQPCLLTRYNYGVEATQETLAALDAAEAALEHYFKQAGKSKQVFRLRFVTHRQPILHVQCERLSEVERQEVHTILGAHGFAEAPIECVDELSGFFDRLENG